MRKGAELVTSKRVNRVNLNFIVRQLDKCCKKNDGWYGNCPDTAICVDAYDTRCGLGEVKCPFCKEMVLPTASCSGCGQPLPLKKKYKKSQRKRLNKCSGL